MADNWHTLASPDEIPSPALLVYPDRVAENIRRMIAALGQAERLRPHVKTHKMAEIVQMQIKAGIGQFKCATIAEAEMLGQAGARDVLLANQPVGPNVGRLLRLAGWFRDVRFSTIADDAGAVGALAEAALAAGITLPVWLDLDAGMGRTGIALGQAAVTLYKLIDQLPGVEPAGLHLYDGHLHDRDPAERLAKWQAMMDAVRPFRTGLEAAGLPVPGVVGGGTPTFPFHAQHTDHECSPGTTLLWDFGYRDNFADLDYQHAAVLMTRVISKPGSDRITLDLGHKAVAAENPQPRVQFIDLDDAEPVVHSEEHLTLRTTKASNFKVGDCLYGIPRHICPTVALYDRAHVIRSGELTDQWQVTARARKLTY
ncbi:MAG: D-TA family PLP-dependent enzyme [Verrucomicrobia bacterium]|nr:D-TA family PLP-dependent enzyme [Verrucomicrobiota bacterium]